MIQLVFSEFQDQLMRGLTHRMNNILSVFHGYLGLLMDDQKLNPVMKEGLSRVRDGARGASDLMERISTVTRPSSCLPREMDPGDLFRQLAPTLERLQTPDVSLTVECPAGLPAITVDLSRMKLAIVELVRNACDAAKSKAIIRVSAGKGPEQPELFPAGGVACDDEHLKIEVIDDGPGIRSSDAMRIYEPFFSTKKKNHTAGLGLTVAVACVQEFGGKLQHQSSGDGTTFEILLPARAAHQLKAVA